MLVGEYKHSIDPKGRLSVPAKFRAELGSSAIVTKGFDQCLFLYPKGEWEKMIEKFASLPLSSSSARAVTRMMTSGAMEVEIDKQGRALLPGYLREYAGITSEAVTTGVLNRVEIWNQQAWAEYSQNSEANSTENAEGLAEWGI